MGSSKTEDDKKSASKEDDLFGEDPDASQRRYSVISYFIVLVLLGVPVWWYTTRVYRADLPLEEMSAIDVPSKTVRQNSLPLSLEYDVLISVMNPDPHTLKLDVNAAEIAANLQPFLDKIRPVAQYHVKSQWVYMTHLGVTTKKVDDHFMITEDQLPHIITPLEKKFWSHMSSRPSINLVLYVPHCEKHLYIYDRNNTPIATNAFISPGWGGVFIDNADAKSCTAERYKPDMARIVATFTAQLQELIGLHSTSADDVRTLKLVKTHEMIDSSLRTLRSLALLLSEISSIVISDDVASQVDAALKSARAAQRLLALGNADEALRMAQVAYRNSEHAFSDPSLLALLYFPDDQKYAVYIPLYLPIMIPVLMSLFKLLPKRKKTSL